MMLLYLLWLAGLYRGRATLVSHDAVVPPLVSWAVLKFVQCMKGSGMGSGNEAEDQYNNSVIVDLTALLIATWLGWPDTPPSSKVTICRKESATSNSNPSLWLVASTSLHCQASTKTAGYHH